MNSFHSDENFVEFLQKAINLLGEMKIEVFFGYRMKQIAFLQIHSLTVYYYVKPVCFVPRVWSINVHCYAVVMEQLQRINAKLSVAINKFFARFRTNVFSLKLFFHSQMKTLHHKNILDL